MLQHSRLLKQHHAVFCSLPIQIQAVMVRCQQRIFRGCIKLIKNNQPYLPKAQALALPFSPV